MAHSKCLVIILVLVSLTLVMKAFTCLEFVKESARETAVGQIHLHLAKKKVRTVEGRKKCKTEWLAVSDKNRLLAEAAASLGQCSSQLMMLATDVCDLTNTFPLNFSYSLYL